MTNKIFFSYTCIFFNFT